MAAGDAEAGGHALAARVVEMEELLALPLDAFLEVKAEETSRSGPSPYDWHSDGCTSPFGILQDRVDDWLELFRPACERHDWAYRNFGPTEVREHDGSEDRRLAIDERLLDDMQAICAQEASDSLRCRVEAQVVYRAVRNGAALVFFRYRFR